MQTPRRSAAIVALTFLCAGAETAGAQQPDTLRQRLRIPRPVTVEVAATGPRVGAGVSISTPSAFGADFGDGFVGLGVQATTRAADRPDAGFVIGFGLGSATRAVGLETAFGLFGTVRSCCRGGVSFKVHRILPFNSAVAIGLENGAAWGELAPGVDIGTDSGRSLYAAVTKVVRLAEVMPQRFDALVVTVGAGNGRFRAESDILDGHDAVNVFGSAALSVGRAANVILNWTGQDLAAGASWAPIADVPLYFSPAVVDLTTDPRFVVGAGYGFDFGSIIG
jgi:hypothetical protein